MRTIAIDPTTSGFGFVVLERSKRLVDWGLGCLAKPDDALYQQRIEKILDRAQPQLLVLEDMRDSRRGDRAVTWAQIAAKCAKKRGIQVERVSRAEVSQHFASSGKTRWKVAALISRRFPELAPSLPKKRRIWESEDRRMAIFAAASFALTFLRVA
jgi:Holliday junction resolvasome RuvABC endonuclease subunit